ncbi:energy transducer TonB [Algoriphagus sediminis]|uniref:Energy transducer TonB n=1 Tax=Algoriphagus sediminis TaxID=3057113 RepID=A0ABT7YA87_9BACT|nr:energy transducer TonB [Algoriphagus sediminis]MDN3203432.1 energy transducer TonB [Algoriphagus sediminis]
MKRVFIGILILFQSSLLTAQELEYLNAYEYPVEDISEYSYSYVKSTSTKGNVIQTQIFNLDTIKVYHATTLLNDKGEASSERVLRYYEDGVMKSNLRQNFDEKTSEEKHYYPNGALKLERIKKKGDTISEKYFDPDGNPADAKDFQEPSPKGGSKAWNKYLTQNLRYPKISMAGGLEGTVVIVFDLDEQGKMTDFKVANPAIERFELEKEAIRVVKFYPEAWEPKMENGVPVKTEIKIPIRFKLS